MRALGSDALAKLWEIIKATFAAKTHEHDAADVASGTLPLARGGTGAALSSTANAIIRYSSNSAKFSSTATKNGALYATSSNGSPQFGTLPIAQGGTGATDAATALANIGAAAADHTHEGHATQSWVNAQIPTKVSAFENDASYASTDWVNNKGYALAADIATTKYNSTSSGSATYFKIADFGSWGTGAWYQKGFSMLIGSRAGETVWLAVSSDDSNTNAKAFRIMNTYGKIAAVYYNVSESSVYVKANAWCNNITAHIISNIGGDYVPSVTVVSSVPSGSVEVNIVEFGPTSSGLAVGDTSAALALGGSATRPTYNGAEVALLSDVSTGGSVSIPARLASYQDHTVAVSDPNNAVETGFYYINTATNRPPFSQSTNVDYRVLTTAYSDQWLQQIATDFRCPDVFIRRRENGTWTSWVRMVSESGGRFTGPISFQDSSMPGKALEFVCGIDAFAAGGQMGWQSKGDFLAGYATTAQLGSYLPLSGGTITNRLYANEWIQFNNQCGLYFPNHNGLHIMPNDVSSYTPLRIIGTRGGYNGAIFGDDKTGLHVMSQATHQGFFNESTGKWIVHYNRDTGTISFGANDAGSANVNVSGSFFSSGKMYQGSTSSDASIASMNRFESDLYVQGNGTAPNGPTVAGFYLGKSTSDENRHMDIVSGGDYSYIDFNKAGRGTDYDVRLLVNVTNGLTDLCWGSVTNPTFNVSGNLTVGGSTVVTAASVPNYITSDNNAAVIYNNASGTTGTVTLTSSAANYNFLEIFYTDGSRTMSQRVYAPNGKTTILERSVFSSTSAFYNGSAIVTINGTSITWSNQGRLVIGTGSAQTVEADTSTLRITYVVGWK